MRGHAQGGGRGTAWLVVAVCCWVWALGAMQALAGWNRTDLRGQILGDKPAFAKLETLREVMAADAPGSRVTAYAQTQRSAIRTPDGTGNTLVDALWMDGYAADIGDWPLAAGTMPALGQELDCALDSATARTLFGSTDIVGRTVEVDGIELMVSAVFTLPEGASAWGGDPGRGLALCPAASLAGGGMEAYAFTLPDIGEPPADCTARWLNEAGLAVPDVQEDRAQTQALWALGAQLLPFLLALWTAWALARAALRACLGAARRARVLAGNPLAARRAETLAVWGMLALALGLGALAVGVLLWPRFRATVPPAYLPTRWSDVSFWGTLWRTQGSAAAQRALDAVLRPALLAQAQTRWIWTLGGAGLAALALARGAVARGAPTGTLPRYALAQWLAVCAAAPLAALVGNRLGWPVGTSPALALLPALWLVSAHILRAWPPESWLAFMETKVKP